MSVKIRNTSKAAWTNAVTSHSLWFHAMECLEKKPNVVIQNPTGSLAKKSGKSYPKTTNFIKSRMCIAIVRASQLRITHSHEPTPPMDGAGLSLMFSHDETKTLPHRIEQMPTSRKIAQIEREK